MRSDLFTLLDRKWVRWRGGPGARSALRRWAAAERCLRRIPDLDALLAMFERCGAATHAPATPTMLAMVRLAPGDPTRAGPCFACCGPAW